MAMMDQYADLCTSQELADANTLPVVYSPLYNMSFFGLEKLHPFDPCKFAKIVSGLKSKGLLDKVGAAIDMPQGPAERMHPKLDTFARIFLQRFDIEEDLPPALLQGWQGWQGSIVRQRVGVQNAQATSL